MNKTNLNQNQFYIDKTEELQKGIEGFPFVYIEGFAACGKSTAVKMLLEKYPGVQCAVFDMEEEGVAENQRDAKWQQEAEDAAAKLCGFLVFENMNAPLSKANRKWMQRFLNTMPEGIHVIFVGRQRPDECLLPYVWGRKMEIIPQEALIFSRSEIQKMIMESGCDVSAKELYEQSGGWAGCVDMMLRLAKRQAKYGEGIIDIKELRRSYEIEHYIQYTIMSALDEDEKDFLEKGIFCPLLNEKLCKDIFEINSPEEILEKLRRKGILEKDAYRNCWKAATAFRPQGKWEKPEAWKRLAEWYAKENYVREVIYCARNANDEVALFRYLHDFYDQVEPADIPGELLLSKKRTSPEMCYLQGLYNYMHQDFLGLDREIVRLEKMHTADAFTKYEILLNLYYLKPDFTVEQWMNLLVKYGEMYGEEQKKFRLYHVLGYSHTYLCGLRDLSALFACSLKEENQNARNFKTYLGEDEWKCYQLAKIDYYLETERQEKITEDEWKILYGKDDKQTEMNIVRLYLSGKLMRTNPSVENEEHFLNLSRKMKGFMDDANVVNAIIQLYSRWTKEPYLMAHWLRYSENSVRAEINEQNYTELCFMMKGYLQINQFEKAERIVKKMIPYLQKYHRTMLLTEILFHQALINWEKELHGQAIQNAIESFLVGAPYRYVALYTNYGRIGEEVLEAYEEWCRTNLLEKWRRKKKYQYGNVLRMPEADYVGVILRLAHKKRNDGTAVSRSKADNGSEEISAERLTMMETMVLQEISRGSTNAQICEALKLKLPTVKTHIYSLYKKLGVSSRVQAVNKGKEMGIV